MKRSTPKLTCPWLKEMIERFSELEEELRLLDPGQRGEPYDVLAMFSPLTDKERTVVALRFCTMVGPILTHREIGERMGLSVTRVSQIEARAMRRLRSERSLNAFRRIVPWQHPSHSILAEQDEYCRRRRRAREEEREEFWRGVRQRTWEDLATVSRQIACSIERGGGFSQEKAELLSVSAKLIKEVEELEESSEQ